MSTTPHLCRSKVKATALEVAAGHRKMSDGSPRFTRVSAQFLEKIEARCREAIRNEVCGQPSVGRTLR